MKKLLIAAGIIATAALSTGCGGAHGNDPGSAYMPDMYYSRAYETYGYNDVGGEFDSLKKRGIYYNAMPVPGSVARGEMMSYHLTPDSNGLRSANSLRNPIDSMALTGGSMLEAERLYLVNCGICHGQQLDGNGPIYNGGNGPYPVAPRNLKDDYTKKLSDGHMFHVITFGIRAMGPYASQLNPAQRWWVVKYIRSKQGAAGGATTSAADSAALASPTNTTPKKDSAATGMAK